MKIREEWEDSGRGNNTEAKRTQSQGQNYHQYQRQ